jgi:hypothetical protein
MLAGIMVATMAADRTPASSFFIFIVINLLFFPFNQQKKPLSPKNQSRPAEWKPAGFFAESGKILPIFRPISETWEKRSRNFPILYALLEKLSIKVGSSFLQQIAQRWDGNFYKQGEIHNNFIFISKSFRFLIFCTFEIGYPI